MISNEWHYGFFVGILATMLGLDETSPFDREISTKISRIMAYARVECN